MMHPKRTPRVQKRLLGSERSLIDIIMEIIIVIISSYWLL